MTANEVLLGLGQRPLDGQHNASLDLTRTGDAALSPELLDQSFQKELASIQRFFEENQAGYENRRRQLMQNPTDRRIISNSGVDLLYSPSFGLEERGRGAPIFRYVAPRTNDGVKKFREGIYFIVMHSFGRGYDYALIQRNNCRSIPIDEKTGHSPSRYALGVRTLMDPKERNSTNIHHILSLRGDLINSVSWDNRCVHGEGGGIGGINDVSIGIEHEEWYMRLNMNQRRPREIEDHGPFSEAQYAIDAFIIKKLEAYTGLTFTNYLGHGEELVQNIKARVPGCFNHASTSRHADPGAEFFLPPGFTYGMDFRKAPMAKDRPGAWERRFAIWYPDLPQGTKISAYDRIFDKVARLRSFDLQTEVFDSALRNERIAIQMPEVRGQYAVAAAQRSAQDRLAAVDRAQQMAHKSRPETFEAAQSGNAACMEGLARQTANLVRIASASSLLPTIENALGFDKTTGTWVNTTTMNASVTNTAVTPATPTTVNSDGKTI